MQLSNSLKNTIVAAASDYAKSKKLSNNDVAKATGINVSYLSNMFRGIYSNKVEGKDVPIGNKWFFKLADWAQIPIEKQYWKVIPTAQFAEIIPNLEAAKESALTTTLIAPTGAGKTYAVDKFVHNNPQHTYRITVSSLHKLADILFDIMNELGIAPNENFYRANSARRLILIILKLREIRSNGGRPILIIDEAENLELPTIKMLKGLYDGISNYSSIVLIGTNQLITKLHRLRKHDASGIPQFFRRIKAGIREVHFKKDFTPFYKEFNVEDKGLQRLLNELCDNYGELKDYLEPALREADEREVELTEDFFRIKYNMPKYQ